MSLAARRAASLSASCSRPRRPQRPMAASPGLLAASRSPVGASFALTTPCEAPAAAPIRLVEKFVGGDGARDGMLTQQPRGHAQLEVPISQGFIGYDADGPPSRVVVHSGSATVRGLLKQDNQDRVLVLTSQDGHATSASSDDNSCATAVFCPPVDGAVTLSAVFDGHGGSHASSTAAQRLNQLLGLDQRLWEALDACSSNMMENGTWDEALAECLQRRWHSAFLRLDEEIIRASRTSGNVDGTTVLAGIHSGECLFVANAGDSRAVLSRSGAAVRLTRDHTPDVMSERARIEACGGMIRHMKGCWRVLLPNEALTQAKICSTSRGLGDADFKLRRLLTCEPEVTSLMLIPELDDLSIFATDGVWAAVDDDDAVGAVRGVLRGAAPGTAANDIAQRAAIELVRLALSRGSADDISVVVHLYEWRGDNGSSGGGSSHISSGKEGFVPAATAASGAPDAADAAGAAGAAEAAQGEQCGCRTAPLRRPTSAGCAAMSIAGVHAAPPFALQPLVRRMNARAAAPSKRQTSASRETGGGWEARSPAAV